jgi:hypothetical protein
MRRTRLRDLKAQAAQTMADAQATLQHADKTLSQAEKSLLVLTENAMKIICAGIEFIENLETKGIEAEAEIMGRKIPAKLRVKLGEESEEEA